MMTPSPAGPRFLAVSSAAFSILQFVGTTITDPDNVTIGCLSGCVCADGGALLHLVRDRVPLDRHDARSDTGNAPAGSSPHQLQRLNCAHACPLLNADTRCVDGADIFGLLQQTAEFPRRVLLRCGVDDHRGSVRAALRGQCTRPAEHIIALCLMAAHHLCCRPFMDDGHRPLQASATSLRVVGTPSC